MGVGNISTSYWESTLKNERNYHMKVCGADVWYDFVSGKVTKTKGRCPKSYVKTLVEETIKSARRSRTSEEFIVNLHNVLKPAYTAPAKSSSDDWIDYCHDNQL